MICTICWLKSSLYTETWVSGNEHPDNITQTGCDRVTAADVTEHYSRSTEAVRLSVPTFNCITKLHMGFNSINRSFLFKNPKWIKFHIQLQDDSCGKIRGNITYRQTPKPPLRTTTSSLPHLYQPLYVSTNKQSNFYN